MCVCGSYSVLRLHIKKQQQQQEKKSEKRIKFFVYLNIMTERHLNVCSVASFASGFVFFYEKRKFLFLCVCVQILSVLNVKMLLRHTFFPSDAL